MKTNKYFYFHYFIYILLIISIIFYLLNKYTFKKKIHEHYLTYFLPFYKKEANDLANFYKNNENNLNYFKKSFNYDTIKFGIAENDLFITKYIVSYYISKSNSYQSSIQINKNKLNGLIDLTKKDIHFNLNNYSTIIYYADNLNGNIDNLRLVTSLYNIYIYVFTKKYYQIFTLNNITYGTKIGILNEPDPFKVYYKKFFGDLGYNENDDYQIQLYNTFDELTTAFNNGICQIIVLSDIFPNSNIENFLNHSEGKDIILLPFDTIKEELFLKKNPQLFIDYVDLNLLSSSYLPKKFGSFEYTVNRPSLKMIATKKILLTNKETESKYTYSIIKFFYENLKYINNNIPEKGYEIKKIEIDNTNVGYLDYHEGVLNYFNSIGLITNNSHPNCKYLYGVMECNEKNLKDNNLWITV